MALTTYLEAEYADGYILQEDENDHSPYDSGHNIFHAILNMRPCKKHGALVRFALITPAKTYTVDWTTLPNDARPIRFVNKSHTWTDGVSQGVQTDSIGFGYQCTIDGKNHQEVVTVT